MIQSLPLELYHMIIGNVHDTTDLLTLSTCCSDLRHEAQRSLFRHAAPKSLKSQGQFASAINAAPLRLGPLVNTLYIHDKPESHDADDILSTSLALCAMTNLQHFTNDGVHISLDVLRDCTFTLRTFVWNCDMSKHAVMVLFRDFLPTQHSLEILRLGPTQEYDATDSPSELCPKLKYLGANNDSIVSTLLRDNRLIRRFQWHGQGCLPKMTGRQLNHLKYLLLCGVQDLSKDTVFASRLTSLVILELRGTHGEFFGLPHLIPVLRNLPRLQILILHILDTFQGLVMHFKSAYQQAFEMCPKLMYIDVKVESQLFYDRYIRPVNEDDKRWDTTRILIERDISEWGQHCSMPGLS